MSEPANDAFVEHMATYTHDPDIQRLVARIRELERERDTAIRNLSRMVLNQDTADRIYEMYKELVAVFPECPVHGECVPHAKAEVARLREIEARMKGLEK